MNREEAANILDLKTRPEALVDFVGPELAGIVHQAMIMGAEALRGPQPDHIPGLVPCGGRKAMLCCTVGEGFWVACSGVSQANRYETEAFAIKAWNESMGYTAPPRPGAIGLGTGEMAPNGDEGAGE